MTFLSHACLHSYSIRHCQLDKAACSMQHVESSILEAACSKQHVQSSTFKAATGTNLGRYGRRGPACKVVLSLLDLVDRNELELVFPFYNTSVNSLVLYFGRYHPAYQECSQYTDNSFDSGIESSRTLLSQAKLFR